MFRAALSATILALMPCTSLQAHPHIFVNVSLTIIYDGATPSAVQVDWIYDDYFSLLITSDLGIDLDGDMVLTPQEKATLTDAVTAWPPDFKGDLEVTQSGGRVTLGPKFDHRMELRDGIIHEIHVRPLQGTSTAPLTLRAYDPFYYVAYQVAPPIMISGRNDCAVQIIPANLDRAYSLVEELLYGRPASDVGPDEEFPEVGVEFADTITVTCG